MINTNYINGKQYPYGFKGWLRKVSFNLIDRYGCFADTARFEAWKRLDPDSWLSLFMDGLSPFDAANKNMRVGS